MDSRLIDNIKPVPPFNLDDLIPVLFTYKGTSKEGIGIEAQQLERLLPVLVKTNVNGSLEVDYAKLSVLLLAVVKDMHERIQVLENNSKKRKTK